MMSRVLISRWRKVLREAASIAGVVVLNSSLYIQTELDYGTS
ncbi:hypothetical protein glysoja_045539 [Glycine soja]|uniref:Uncharacterized protein n=1 Tax=Glycine soja TaxID=3848 RepID=A0A0B2QDS0_GLYSO|nr:hypothetical protein glysoja_045539 [Glycine soja]